ncbi:unnamed protein product [Polarella glacialis]|uniref:Uncharacterized protein n=1 Tax=Polarella glacialis TaxID=89957 RepID=A0A813KTE1_POLGL|nr:unnamed protein product [Polarella glacialis]
MSSLMSPGRSSTSSSRLASSTGMMVLCPGPPPPHHSMMSRYHNLETGLQVNWADLHIVSGVLGTTRGEATTEISSMSAMVLDQRMEAQRTADLKKAEEHSINEWLVNTLGVCGGSLTRTKSSGFFSGGQQAISRSGLETSMWQTNLYARDGPRMKDPTATKSRKEVYGEDRPPGGEPLAANWATAHRDHVKESCSPITAHAQAHARWEYLFGDLAVAYAEPGTGVAAFSGGGLTSARRPSSRSAPKLRFSNSASWAGLKRGELFDVALRAKDQGPVSAITLPEECEKRSARGRMLSTR